MELKERFRPTIWFSVYANITTRPRCIPHQGLPSVQTEPEIFYQEIGRISQVEITSNAISGAMKAANLDKPSDAFCSIKCPLLATEKIQHARERGAEVVTKDTYASMGYFAARPHRCWRCPGQLNIANITDGIIYLDRSVWVTVGASAGVEIENCEVIVMGNSAECPVIKLFLTMS